MIIERHEVFLVDDGTLDTVISVDGSRVTFSQEYAAQHRNKKGILTNKGFKQLAKEAIDFIEEDRAICQENQ